ncbi:DUF3165 family protein [Streptococcus sp. zg-JUN1979]|uniref:DUF3165 family protein n=1 Tax=Streptococcus sp. zg-JUN1979 TaxID=3391450 RepID=UPI0039A5DB21
MFYFIILLLLLLYYFFMAPRSVKKTLEAIGMVGIAIVILILIAAGIVAFLGMSKVFYISLVMTMLGFWAIRDLLKMPVKAKHNHSKM